MTDRRQRLLAWAIVALAPTLLFGDVLFGLSSFYTRDVTLYHYPHQKMLRDIVLAGEFPWWNPMISAGQPMAANPAYQVFYPLTWLILLPDYLTGFHLLALLHLYLAAFGMYALLRSMSLGRPAACFGAVSFGVGGLVVSMLNLFPFLFSTAWLPLTCLFGRRFLLHRQPRDFAFASFCLGIQLILGEPVTAVQTGLLLGFYALYRSFGVPRVPRGSSGSSGSSASGEESPEEPRNRGTRGTVSRGTRGTAVRHLGAIALISLAALLLSAVQVLPAIDHLGDSTRGQGMTWRDVRSWSTPPLRLGEAVFPNILGRMDIAGTPVFWGSKLYPDRNGAFFFSVYAGLAAAILALAGLFARMRGAGLFAAVAVTSALVSTGDHTPLLRLLYESGAGSIVRFPEKFLIMGVFGIVVFGAHALDHLLAGDERLRRIAMRVTLGVIAVAFLAAAAMAVRGIDPLVRTVFQIPQGRSLETIAKLFRKEFLVAGLRALFLLLLFRNVLDPRRTVWLVLFGGFVLFDLAGQAPQIAPRISPSFFREPPPTVRHFAPDRDEYRILNLASWDSKRSIAQRYFGTDATYWWVVLNALPPMTPATWNLRTVVDSDFDVTDLQPELDFTQAFWDLSDNGPPDWMETAATMANVRYLGVYRSRDEALRLAGGWNRNVEPVKFVAGRDHPRYYFAEALVTIRGKEDFVRAIRTQHLPRKVAFIHEPAFRPAPGVVRGKKEWSSGARIDVEAAGPAFLVMSVTPHKYWRVTIDGEEVPSLVTNLGFQGVAVPPGRHVVEMRYRNPLVPAGAAVSVAALLGLTWLVTRKRAVLVGKGAASGGEALRSGEVDAPSSGDAGRASGEAGAGTGEE